MYFIFHRENATLFWHDVLLKSLLKHIYQELIWCTIGPLCVKNESHCQIVHYYVPRAIDALLHWWHTSRSVCKIMLRYENTWQENKVRIAKKTAAAFCNSEPSPWCRDYIVMISKLHAKRMNKKATNCYNSRSATSKLHFFFSISFGHTNRWCYALSRRQRPLLARKL